VNYAASRNRAEGLCWSYVILFIKLSCGLVLLRARLLECSMCS